jgi:hypothetical protein
MSTTFEVDRDVKLCRDSLDHKGVVERLTTPKQRTGESILKSGGEASGANTPGVIFSLDTDAPKNGFLEAIHVAYDRHYGLVLSPDDIWLAIAQGFSQHVLADPEALRERFVPGSKAGTKETIKVQRDHFVKGSPDNDWPGAFGEFGDQIGERIGKEKLALLRSNFSTTGVTEKAASEIVLLESMKEYFSYVLRTCCGIPEITLLGSVGDWKDIVARTKALGEFNLSWWVDDLIPTLDQFVAAAQGRADPTFWSSIYKLKGPDGSGGPVVTGWVNQFFPYLSGSYKNPYAFGSKLKETRGLRVGSDPAYYLLGLSKAPFMWLYHDQSFQMEFVGGFVGSSLDEGFRMRPSIGWLVREEDGQPDQKPGRGW